MKERKVNYHTHTARCLHATGTDEDYVKAALQSGYTLLGFSDHSPWHYPSGYIPTMRMREKELPEYVASVRGLAEKYKDEIEIRLALECEYFPDKIAWLKETARLHRLDYLIFGNHFFPTDETAPYYGRGRKTPAQLKEYYESSAMALDSGLFAYFAHPDIFMRGHDRFGDEEKALCRELCRLANHYKMPVEYNIAGVDDLTAEGWETAHGGYDPVYANADADRVLPVDVLRQFEKEGKIGKLHDFFYTTTGNGTAVASSKAFAAEYAQKLLSAGVDAVIMTST